MNKKIFGCLDWSFQLNIFRYQFVDKRTIINAGQSDFIVDEPASKGLKDKDASLKRIEMQQVVSMLSIRLYQ